jgi:hypothetical protein
MSRAAAHARRIERVCEAWSALVPGSWPASVRPVSVVGAAVCITAPDRYWAEVLRARAGFIARRLSELVPGLSEVRVVRASERGSHRGSRPGTGADQTS